MDFNFDVILRHFGIVYICPFAWCPMRCSLPWVSVIVTTNSCKPEGGSLVGGVSGLDW
jgi:hypothetical protein